MSSQSIRIDSKAGTKTCGICEEIIRLNRTILLFSIPRIFHLTRSRVRGSVVPFGAAKFPFVPFWLEGTSVLHFVDISVYLLPVRGAKFYRAS